MDNEILRPDLGHDDVDGQECKDGRSRTWMLLLYPDNPDHMTVIESKLYEHDWNFAGRVHDNDDGVKLHHHVVVLFKDGRKAADVADDLGIEPRWLRAWDRQKKALRYLCHRDNPEKYQYSTDMIYGTIAEKAVAACTKGDKLSESASVAEIIKALDEIEGIISYKFFISLMAEKGCYDVFRRMGVLGTRLIDEHNYVVQRQVLVEQRAQLDVLGENDGLVRSMERSKSMSFADRIPVLERVCGTQPLQMPDKVCVEQTKIDFV